MKNKKHNKVVRNYEEQKRKHLAIQANKMIDKDIENVKWQSKTINKDFLDLF